MHWVTSEKIHTPSMEEISAVQRGGENNLFLMIVSVLEHLKGVGGLLYNFICGGGMGVF